MHFLHGVCPFNDSSNSIISSNANLCHQTLGVCGNNIIQREKTRWLLYCQLFNDCSKSIHVWLQRCNYKQQDVQEETVEDLTSVMAHLSEGLQQRSVSCKWLGRLSSQVFWVGLIYDPVNSLLPFNLWPRHWEASYGFSLAFSLLTTQCYSAPTKSPGFLNHGKHRSHHPSHIMSAAKRAAVCLRCVSAQKDDSILGACCCCACSILSTHHFLKLLIHKLGCGLDYAKAVAVNYQSSFMVHFGSQLQCCRLMYHNRNVVHQTTWHFRQNLWTYKCLFYLAMCNTQPLRIKQSKL